MTCQKLLKVRACDIGRSGLFGDLTAASDAFGIGAYTESTLALRLTGRVIFRLQEVGSVQKRSRCGFTLVVKKNVLHTFEVQPGHRESS